MPPLQPLYTADNCTFSHPLRWGLTVFRRSPPPHYSYADLTRILEADGVRLLGQRITEPCLTQFSVSTRAEVPPLHIVTRLKGPINVAPAAVALAFLNNLAYVHGMRPVFQYGAYVSTFGEYHQGAVVSDGVRYPDDAWTEDAG